MNFNNYLIDRPYKPTKAFTKAEWEHHLYEIWEKTYGLDAPELEITTPCLREYTITLQNGNKVPVHAKNYMDARLVAMKTFNVAAKEIKSVL